jgi:hypothetical protein
MKLIEALKKLNFYKEKMDDLKKKIRDHSADMDFENPIYENQLEKVSEWMQMHNDTVKEYGRLKYCISKTNNETMVSIDLFGKSVTKSIFEWIIRRRELIMYEKAAWSCLTDKGLQDRNLQQSSGEIKTLKIRRYYDPVKRDKALFNLGEEPCLIDGALEIANATTDLIE